jgi:hypothetical protein
MERETVTGALKRAWTLSKGRWWRTCGTLVLAILVTVFMGFFALRIPFLLIQLIFFTDPSGTTTAILPALTVDTVGRIVSWSVVLPFDAGVIALLYMDRRMRREGLDLELRTRLLERTRAPKASGHLADPAQPAASGPGNGVGNGPGNGVVDDGFFEHWRPAARPRHGASRGMP